MRIGPGKRGGRAQAGVLVVTLFGAVFLAVGLALTAFIGREALGVIRAWTSWVRTPCTIVDSGASLHGDDEHPYRFEVRYTYRWRGAALQGTTFRKRYLGSADFRPVQTLLLAYPAGRSTACFVDPDDPAQAVLQRRSPFFVLVILFPLLFVAVGAGMVYAAWSHRRRPAAEEALGGARSLGVRGRRIAFGVLLVAGLGVAAAMVPWMLGPIRARSWVEVPATVVSSKVRRRVRHNDGGGQRVTWKVDVLYGYTYGGIEYHSNRYGFFDTSSSGRAAKVARARRYRPGAIIRVRVNPRDPTWAVIAPGYTAGHLLFLLPLLAVAAGFAGLRWTAKPRPAGVPGMAPRSTMAGDPFPGALPPRGPVELRPRGGRVKKAAAIALVAVFWNGVISVFLWNVVEGFTRGRPDWFLTVFMVPFVLVGLLLALGALHALLALINPRTTLSVDRAMPRLGETLGLGWRTRGAAGRLRSLGIVLEGREEATYRRGTRTITKREVFARLEIARCTDPHQIREGRVELEIPADTMHSFHGGSNEILWELKVEGKIRLWPDVDDSWPLEIVPAIPGAEGPWTG